MAYHSTTILGCLNKLTGSSTEYPETGEGAVSTWSLFNNINANLTYQIPPQLYKHFIVIQLYQGTNPKTPVQITEGSLEVMITDNGLDWGTVENHQITFDGSGSYNRINFMGPIADIRIELKGIKPLSTNDIPMFVAIQIHSYS